MASNKRRASKKKSTARKKPPYVTMGILGVIAVAIGVLAYLAFGTDGGETSSRRLRQEPVATDEAEVTIDVIDDDYRPRDLTIRAGTKITWKHKGNDGHTVTDFEGAFDSGVLNKGDSYVLTFADPGQYEYYCTLHHAMQGKLTIIE